MKACHKLAAVIAFSFFLLNSGLAYSTTKLTVQLSTPAPSASFLGLYVAQNEGFFRDENLEVEARPSSGGPLAVQLAARGDADLAFASFEPYVLGFSQGMRGKYIMRVYGRLVYYLAVPAESNIKTISDLKDKRIGVLSMGTVTYMIARSMLRQSGVEPKPDMFLPVGFGDTALTALKSNNVQALSLWDANYASMERAGNSFRYFYHPTIGNIGNGGYFASDKTLVEKKDAIQAFLRAVVRAHIFIRNNPEAALKAYWTANPAGKIGATPEEQRNNGLVELKSLFYYFDDTPYGKVGEFDLSVLPEFLRVMREEGATGAQMSVSDLATNEFISVANKVDPAPVIEKAKNAK